MIEHASRIETLDSIGLWVLEELGFGTTRSGPYSLEVVVEVTVGIVEVLDGSDISVLAATGGDPTADICATYAWMEWTPGTAGHRAAALAVIAHLSEMIA